MRLSYEKVIMYSLMFVIGSWYGYIYRSHKTTAAKRQLFECRRAAQEFADVANGYIEETNNLLFKLPMYEEVFGEYRGKEGKRGIKNKKQRKKH